jgi:hypothetical protein
MIVLPLSMLCSLFADPLGDMAAVWARDVFGVFPAYFPRMSRAYSFGNIRVSVRYAVTQLKQPHYPAAICLQARSLSIAA